MMSVTMQNGVTVSYQYRPNDKEYTAWVAYPDPEQTKVQIGDEIDPQFMLRLLDMYGRMEDYYTHPDYMWARTVVRREQNA